MLWSEVGTLLEKPTEPAQMELDQSLLRTLLTHGRVNIIMFMIMMLPIVTMYCHQYDLHCQVCVALESSATPSQVVLNSRSHQIQPDGTMSISSTWNIIRSETWYLTWFEEEWNCPLFFLMWFFYLKFSVGEIYGTRRSFPMEGVIINHHHHHPNIITIITLIIIIIICTILNIGSGCWSISFSTFPKSHRDSGHRDAHHVSWALSLLLSS